MSNRKNLIEVVKRLNIETPRPPHMIKTEVLQELVNNSPKGLVASSVIPGYNDSELAKKENKDCAVRALAVLLDVTYEEAHKIAEEKFARKPKSGTRLIQTIGKGTTILDKEFTPIDRTEITYKGSHRFIKNYNIKGKKRINIVVRELLEKYNTGSYMVIVRKHAFALKDGIIIGNSSDITAMKRKVLHLIEVKDAA